MILWTIGGDRLIELEEELDTEHILGLHGVLIGGVGVPCLVSHGDTTNCCVGV